LEQFQSFCISASRINHRCVTSLGPQRLLMANQYSPVYPVRNQPPCSDKTEILKWVTIRQSLRLFNGMRACSIVFLAGLQSAGLCAYVDWYRRDRMFSLRSRRCFEWPQSSFSSNSSTTIQTAMYFVSHRVVGWGRENSFIEHRVSPHQGMDRYCRHELHNPTARWRMNR
jgi:hypothetical protein